jgi:mannose-6-phosphate isomerase-like protein (cupin superfamily)
MASPMSYTVKNLSEVDDAAVKGGFSDNQEAHFGRDALDATDTGFAYHIVKPGKKQAFGHRHEDAEEVYVIIGGEGRVKLDDDIVELKRLDAIRVAPTVARRFEAGPDGLEFLVFGARREGDGEILPDFWSG